MHKSSILLQKNVALCNQMQERFFVVGPAFMILSSAKGDVFQTVDFSK